MRTSFAQYGWCSFIGVGCRPCFGAVRGRQMIDLTCERRGTSKKSLWHRLCGGTNLDLPPPPSGFCRWVPLDLRIQDVRRRKNLHPAPHNPTSQAGPVQALRPLRKVTTATLFYSHLPLGGVKGEPHCRHSKEAPSGHGPVRLADGGLKEGGRGVQAQLQGWAASGRGMTDPPTP